ncbi:MAG: winged helix-turn-helix domain-containing protein [Mangrovibacterium sp.]
MLDLIQGNPQITRKQLSATVGIAESAIQKHLNSLICCLGESEAFMDVLFHAFPDRYN